jgi:hypothetical protein
MTDIRGQIVFEGDAPFLETGRVHVFLEDTTYADASAIIVRHDVLAAGALVFEMTGLTVEPQRVYTIRVLVDLDGDGRVSRGDFITTESYPVLTRGRPAEVTVVVRRIP